jgi:hypothetical protein
MFELGAWIDEEEAAIIDQVIEWQFLSLPPAELFPS